jgi:hypothetical protein
MARMFGGGGKMSTPGAFSGQALSAFPVRGRNKIRTGAVSGKVADFS